MLKAAFSQIEDIVDDLRCLAEHPVGLLKGLNASVTSVLSLYCFCHVCASVCVCVCVLPCQ